MTTPGVGVFVVGAGRAGRSLCAALAAAGRPALGVHGRRPDAAVTEAPYSIGPYPAALRAAAVVVAAVRDGELDPVLAALAGRLAPGAVLLHMSGATEPASLAALRDAGHPCGTFHPLVPLSDPAAGAAAFRGAYVGVDGDSAAANAASDIAGVLGAHALRIPPGAKARYHAAAVFASNFPVVLAAEAERLMTTAGIDGGDARGAVAALLGVAAANVRALGPARALTGPAARGDAATVGAHVAALAGDEDATAAYVTLTRAAVGLAAPAGAAAVLGALEGA